MSPYQCQRVEEMKPKKQHTSSHSLETWFLECFIKDADSILACVNDFIRFFSFNSFVYYRRRWREEEVAKDATVNKRAARCSYESMTHKVLSFLFVKFQHLGKIAVGGLAREPLKPRRSDWKLPANEIAYQFNNLAQLATHRSSVESRPAIYRTFFDCLCFQFFIRRLLNHRWRNIFSYWRMLSYENLARENENNFFVRA